MVVCSLAMGTTYTPRVRTAAHLPCQVRHDGSMPTTDQNLVHPGGRYRRLRRLRPPGQPGGPRTTVVVAHGAGAGMEHPFLRGFTDALNELGLATLRFNFPYREAGRKFPDRPPLAIATWRAVMDTAAEQATVHGDTGTVWACGKSFGGRMASMAVAEGMPAAGLVYLGYPLHPPGKPEKLRDEHLYGLTTAHAVPAGQPGHLCHCRPP